MRDEAAVVFVRCARGRNLTVGRGDVASAVAGPRAPTCVCVVSAGRLVGSSRPVCAAAPKWDETWAFPANTVLSPRGSFLRRVAAPSWLRRGCFFDESRRRRGCDVDIPPTSRDGAAAATWIFRGDEWLRRG